MAKHDFLIFGATGMQGRIVSRDLFERGYRIALSDLSRKDFAPHKERFPGVVFTAADLRKPETIAAAIRRTNPAVVINCAEMDWNVAVYRAALEAGVHIIDLGTDMPWVQEQFAMHDAFRERGLTAITGCGSTPGITDIMLDHAAAHFDRLQSVDVGFVWDSSLQEFVVPFSMDTIMSEFTDAAPYIERGRWREKLPMNSVRRMKFRGIEEQRCFLAPHPETYTYRRAYRERGLHTVRFYSGFPDHSFDAIASLLSTMDDAKRVTVDGVGLVRREHLTKVMEAKHPYPDGYTERENLWVRITGEHGGELQEVLMECLVPPMEGWEEAGCNVDTGFPASIIAEMVLKGDVSARGSFSPGQVVPPALFFRELESRGMRLYCNGQRLLRSGRVRAVDRLPVVAAL
ncbi:MAG TPA: saccharopine dehydrogenase C-terminal domain-containing protein [Candidatus Paceibacterota bacterium]|nr:saccharopine dehydrogenase C-terminal domain-containing protein [Candidatus Paceibacterota bacterium]